MSSLFKGLTIWGHAKDVIDTATDASADVASSEAVESWINYKTILFTAVVLFGTGYALKGLSNTISSVDDAFDGE